MEPLMGATIDQIDDAIDAALRPLLIVNGGPFALLDKFTAGDVSKTDGVAQEVLKRSPAMLVAWDGEKGTDDLELLTGAAETVGMSTFTVLVILQETRATALGLKGAVGQPGIYRLTSIVRDTLNNLVIDGLVRNGRLAYVGAVPVLFKRGQVYVTAVRFTAAAVVGDAAVPDSSVPLLGLTGHEHLHDEAGPAAGAPDPIVTFAT
jgi:hypothetical protein